MSVATTSNPMQAGAAGATGGFVARAAEDIAFVEGPSRARRLRARLLPPVLAFAALIAVWYFFAWRLHPNRKFLLPTPDAVITKGLWNAQAFREMMGSLLLTTEVALVGLVIAIVLGLGLAVAMYQFRPLERAAYPYLVALQAIPILAIVPLMTVAFGYGFNSKVVVCVIIAFFPIPTNALLGMRSVDTGMGDLFTLQRANWYTRLRKLSFPNSLPALFAGLRISAGLSVVGAIVGELFFQQGRPGLGLRLTQYRQTLEYPQLFMCLIWASLLGIAVYLFFGWLGNRALRNWHESARVEA